MISVYSLTRQRGVIRLLVTRRWVCQPWLGLHYSSLLNTTLCIAPDLMEALIAGKDEDHGCTEEVFAGVAGAGDASGA
jgi:hypothetical protein